MGEIFEGGCFCGGIRYRMHGRPMFIRCCHCTDCQRQTGSAFAMHALVEADRVEPFQGRPTPLAVKAESGLPHDIYRCTDCGTSLWIDHDRRGWMLSLQVSSLDRRAEFSPDVHVFTRSKVAWVELPVHASVFEEDCSTNSIWPLESLARREAARVKAGA